MQLWRIHIKPDADEGVVPIDFCVGKGIAGIGWGVSRRPTSKDDYRSQIEKEYTTQFSEKWPRWRKSWCPAANAMLDDIQIGDLIWTRSQQAKYFLGRIYSEWQYSDEVEHAEADIFNFRRCTWMEVGLMDNVPGSVINSFNRSATVQRVRDPNALLYSSYLYANECDERFSPPDNKRSVDILQLLSDEDLEDAVALYLQVQKGLKLYPTTCKLTTKAVECLLVSPDDGQRIGMQVKSGQEAVDQNAFADFGTEPQPDPLYRTKHPNDDVPLYQGDITLGEGDNECRLRGRVLYQWRPSPRVCFCIDEAASLTSHAHSTQFAINGSIGNCPAIILAETHSSSHKPTSVQGSLNGELQIGSSDGIRMCQFHIVNFENFRSRRPPDADSDWSNARLNWETDDWQLRIDAVSDLRKLEKQLKCTGGYLISHIAQLTRKDASTFSADEARTIQAGLCLFLSFVVGRWVGAILPLGFDTNNDVIWQQWAPWRLASWRSGFSWADPSHGEVLGSAFSGFLRRWEDPAWKSAIGNVIHCYVHSNTNAADL